MRIGIDLFALVPGAGRGPGFYRYTTALIPALGRLDDRHQYLLFVNRANAGLFPNSGKFRQIMVRLPADRRVWPFRLLWQHAALPLRARRERLELLHFPMDTASLAPGLPYVATVNDIITDVYYPRAHPGTVSPLRARYFFYARRQTVRGAARVLCPSWATAGQLVEHYGADPARIAVTPYGVDTERFTPRPPDPAPSGPPYVLCVASLSRHKNLSGAIAAYAAARERVNLPHELWVAGMPGTGAAEVLRGISGEAARLPIRYLGLVPEDRLPGLYAGASALLFLSFVEGFGLPPLEAMASGVPVVASNASSLPEVCGEAALLVPPNDTEAGAAALARAINDRDLRDRLVAAGLRRAKEFSWERTAKLTCEAYEAAAERARALTSEAIHR